jgi:hypothetical protein
MNDDERIDAVLNKMNSISNGRISIQQFLNEELKDSDQLSFQRIVPALEARGFAFRLAGLSATCEISDLGRRIVKDGGYLKYLERLNNDQLAEIEAIKNSRKLDEVNLELNTFYLRFKWIPFVLSGIAILLSIAAIIISLIK